MRTTLLQALERTQIKVDSDHAADFIDIKVVNNGKIFDMKEFCQ